MSQNKRIIAVLDLPPARAVKHVRDSYAAAANRWGADLYWIQANLKPWHPFWQKMLVCEHVKKRFGDSHVLQLDNDMLIRSDCPSPFDRVQPDQFGMVAERQCAQNRMDKGGWHRRAHTTWARRCALTPAPTWIHPNGGLYLYDTERFAPLFGKLGRMIHRTDAAIDLAPDESLIVNQLWTDHRDAIAFLPGDFNVSMSQAPDWARTPVMQSYVYHFISKTKKHLQHCQWQRRDPVELPYSLNQRSRKLIELWKNDPPPTYDMGRILRVEPVANLLAVYPELIVSGTWHHRGTIDERRLTPDDDTQIPYLMLSRFLIRLGVNARRFRLRVTDS
jgi:hypothetical protein